MKCLVSSHFQLSSFDFFIDFFFEKGVTRKVAHILHSPITISVLFNRFFVSWLYFSPVPGCVYAHLEHNTNVHLPVFQLFLRTSYVFHSRPSAQDNACLLLTTRNYTDSLLECCFTTTETVGLLGTGSQGRPPRLSHSSWALNSSARLIRRYIYPHNKSRKSNPRNTLAE